MMEGQQLLIIEERYIRYYAQLCEFACCIVARDEIAEDLVQDVFVSLLENNQLSRVSPRSERYYLYGMVKHAALSKARRRNIIARIFKKYKPAETQELLSGTCVVATAVGRIDVSPVDMDEALTWKDGYSYFNQKTMDDILDEQALWFGVEVRVKRILPDKQYVGGIKRSETLAPVGALLAEMSGRKFTIAEKKLIVY